MLLVHYVVRNILQNRCILVEEHERNVRTLAGRLHPSQTARSYYTSHLQS